MEYRTYNSTELTHHGIKGMRWGVRRYQNKDGSLTPAGKKRRDKLEAEINKLGGKKENEAATRKKSISEMTDDELRAHTNRMALEKNYREAEINLAKVTPKQISKGQKFANTLMDNVIQPALANSGRKALEQMMDKAAKKAFGDAPDVDSVEALTKVRDKLKLKKEIDQYKNPEKYMSEEDKNKRQQREYAAEDRAAQKRGYKDAADEARAKSKAEADERARQENAKRYAKDQEAYANAAGKKTSVKPDDDSYENINWDEYKREKPPTVDVEPYDVTPYLNAPESTRRAGEDYVSNYLGLPAPKDGDD